jgi:hypothetical protein
VWPNTQYIIGHLFQSQYEDVRTWAGMIDNSDDSDQFEEFCKKLHQHDQYRGLDFAQTFPEMAHALLTVERIHVSIYTMTNFIPNRPLVVESPRGLYRWARIFNRLQRNFFAEPVQLRREKHRIL